MKPQHATLWVLLLWLCSQLANGNRTCVEGEREALLRFRAGLHDPSGRLSSWSGPDCCGWEGVRCSRRTGHVVRLDLRNPEVHFDDYGGFTFTSSDCLGGEIDESLLGLRRLKHLDLSMNHFGGIPIPPSIGSLPRLRHLNLSCSCFGSDVPPQLGNLSRLQSLDLSQPYILDRPPNWDQCGVSLGSDQWLSRLPSLQYLNLIYVQVRSPSTLFHSLSTIPSLVELHLSWCSIHTLPSLLSFNSTSLRLLDLSRNGIYSIAVPPWLFELKNLEHLDLSFNIFQPGLIPDAIGNLTSLKTLQLSGFSGDLGEIINPATLLRLCTLNELDLSHNHYPHQFHDLREAFSGCISDSLESLRWSDGELRGHLPEQLGMLKNLKTLELSSNELYGTVPERLGQLHELVRLDLSVNKLQGELVEAHFTGLTRLEHLDFSSNKLSLSVGPDWSPPPLLTWIDFSHCYVGPRFPTWLQKLRNVLYICMRRAGISGAMPDGSWNFSSVMRYVDMSGNEIRGRLPISLEHLDLHYFDLSDNQLDGPLPLFSSGLLTLDISNNSLSGEIPDHWNNSSTLSRLLLGNNRLSGSIPESIGSLSSLWELQLSNNRLSGSIPKSIGSLSNLQYLYLDNNLSGSIPKSIGSLSNLQYLHLGNNNLSGNIPESIGSLSILFELQLGNNRLSGSIPESIGSLSSLWELQLSNNRLSGSIPKSIGALSTLIYLQLSNNNLSGSIPKSIGSLYSLGELHLGNNRLSGSIPKSIGSLFLLGILQVGNNSLSGELPLLNCTLIVLDLGHNELSGNFPVWIGEKLKNLLILRLRANMFTGTIPDELGGLAFLRVIDLALNNLSGAIPRNFGNLNGIRFADVYLSNGIYKAIVSVILDFRGREDEYFTAPATIDLAGNSLHGVIPEEIATLRGLQNLNLAGNRLTGNIPKNISMLRELESLDLSFNILSGSIPADMTAMSFLDHLNLSFNNLSGQIPSGGQFQALPDQSIYTGNPDLCGYPLDVTCNDGGGASQAHNDGEDRHNDSEAVWFYMSMVFGFVFGFWAFCGTLLVNRKWSITFFRSADKLISPLEVAVAINLAKIRSYWSS